MSTSTTADLDGLQTVTATQNFRIFLVLQIYLLTQPSGSLFNLRNGGWLWRCNPIDPLVEAFIIIRYLFGSIPVYALHQIAHSNSALFQPSEYPENRTQPAPSQCGIRHVAAALLVLRTASGTKTDDILFLDVTSTRLQRSILDIGSGDVFAQDFLSVVQDPRLFDSGSQPPTARPNGPLGPSTVSYGLGRSASNIVNQSSAQSAKQRRDLAYASGALLHRDWRIDAMTTLTALTITLKLFATQGATLFKILAFPLIFGWATLQCILVILHSSQMTDADRELGIVIATQIRASLNSQTRLWHVLFACLHIPLIMYYQMCDVYYPHHTTIHLSLSFANAITNAWLFALVAGAAIAPAFSRKSKSSLNQSLDRPNSAVVTRSTWALDAAARQTVSAISCTLCIAVMITMILACKSWAGQMHLVLSTTHGTTKPRTWVDPGAKPFLLVGKPFIYFIPVCAWMCGGVGTGHRKLDRFLSSFSNVLFSLGLLAWYLLMHDSTSTFKPTWTDWLG